MNYRFNENNPSDRPLAIKVTKMGKTKYIITNIPCMSESSTYNWINRSCLLFPPQVIKKRASMIEAYNVPGYILNEYLENGTIPAGCITLDESSKMAKQIFGMIKNKSLKIFK